MTFDLGEDEEYGVIIAVNSILKRFYRIGEHEDWSQQHDEWWNSERSELGDRTPQAVVRSDPDAVIDLALAPFSIVESID